MDLQWSMTAASLELNNTLLNNWVFLKVKNIRAQQDLPDTHRRKSKEHEHRRVSPAFKVTDDQRVNSEMLAKKHGKTKEPSNAEHTRNQNNFYKLKTHRAQTIRHQFRFSMWEMKSRFYPVVKMFLLQYFSVEDGLQQFNLQCISVNCLLCCEM